MSIFGFFIVSKVSLISKMNNFINFTKSHGLGRFNNECVCVCVINFLHFNFDNLKVYTWSTTVYVISCFHLQIFIGSPGIEPKTSLWLGNINLYTTCIHSLL